MKHSLCLALLVLGVPASPTVRHGVAARHNSLDRVARIRGMDVSGPLFASPLDPIGTRLCVSSARVRRPICGVVVDVAAPADRAWQLRTGRIIEVQPAIARLLCADPLGPPRDCAVTVWRTP